MLLCHTFVYTIKISVYLDLVQIDQNHTIVHMFEMEDFCLRREKNHISELRTAEKKTKNFIVFIRKVPSK